MNKPVVRAIIAITFALAAAAGYAQDAKHSSHAPATAANVAQLRAYMIANYSSDGEVVLSDGEHWRCTNLDLLERSTKQARINVRFCDSGSIKPRFAKQKVGITLTTNRVLVVISDSLSCCST